MSLEWSAGWLKEGYYISYIREGVRYYEYIVARDLAHYVYTWPEVILPLSTSGPFVPENLEITRGYDEKKNQNHIWQLIFGIDGQAYIYIELPTDLHRHGLPKKPKPTADLREVSHFEEWMSPYKEPTFITEHFLMRPGYDRIAISAYNPNTTWIYPRIRFFINKMITERIGTVEGKRLVPSKDRYRELLDKLYRHVVPSRPITLEPVRLPAEAPGGE